MTGSNDRGRLLGSGLTHRPTRHRYMIDGRVLFTFCAADTLIVTPILGACTRRVELPNNRSTYAD